jgi:guanosine-3',5'-bis(diphosphate) 3'-pyrophosphohydrolase
LVRPVLEPLASLHRQSHAKADLALLQRAYDVAEAAHAGQKRKSGDPYITHPLAVATILANLGMDTTTLVAALLHDTIEDTDTTAAELEAQFGPRITGMVVEVTDDESLPKAEKKRLQIEHAPGLSPGAKLVKLADKICNLRDVADRPPAKWDLQRRQEYFEWAKRVIDGLRGVHPGLEAAFDAAYERKP